MSDLEASARSVKEWLAAYRQARARLASGELTEVSLYRRDLRRIVVFDKSLLKVVDQQIRFLEEELQYGHRLPKEQPRQWA